MLGYFSSGYGDIQNGSINVMGEKSFAGYER